jgi:hypothetical protein
MALSLALHGLAVLSLFLIAGTLGSILSQPPAAYPVLPWRDSAFTRPDDAVLTGQPVAAWVDPPVRFHPR